MKYLKLVLVLIVMSLPITSFAQGVYFGGSFANTDFDSNLEAVDGSADDSDSGYKILIGNRFTPNVAGEIGFVQFGKTSFTGDSFIVDPFIFFVSPTLTLEAEIEALTFSGVFSTNLVGDVSVFGRLGMALWDAEFTASTSLGSASESHDGTDIFFGLGIQTMVNENLGLRLEYEIYNLDPTDTVFNSKIDQINMLSIGAVFHF